MLDKAEILLADPLLGLHVGQKINARHIGILGFVILACENLGDALQRLERYHRLVIDIISMTYYRESDWFELSWDTSQYETSRLVNETGMALMVQFCRNLVREPFNPLLVSFSHSGPPDTSPYEQYFGCPVLFEQTKVSLRLKIDLLSEPLKSPDKDLLVILEQHANSLLAKLPRQNEIVEQVRAEIARAFLEGVPNIEQISKQLSYSSRILQRRLHEVGTGFRYELNTVRQELGLSYLRDPRLRIVDIAFLLGYSEHSAFTRAFKEYYGCTPQKKRDEIELNAQKFR